MFSSAKLLFSKMFESVMVVALVIVTLGDETQICVTSLEEA
jgi:hypothetical protein